MAEKIFGGYGGGGLQEKWNTRMLQAAGMVGSVLLGVVAYTADSGANSFVLYLMAFLPE